MLTAAGATSASLLPLTERRDAFRKLMNLSESDVAIGHVENRVLPGPEGPIAIRVYTPIEARSDRLPGLVFFHGGGLVTGASTRTKAFAGHLPTKPAAGWCQLITGWRPSTSSLPPSWTAARRRRGPPNTRRNSESIGTESRSAETRPERPLPQLFVR